MELAAQNQKLAATFMEKQQMVEALDALHTALEFTEKAFGVQSLESAPLYHKFGTILMTVTAQNAEEGFSNTLMSAMQNQMDEEGAQKITKEDLEEEAQNHVQSFDEAWEALEIARLIYQNANDMVSVAKVRMSLGDACLDVDEYEDASKEFGEAAKLRQEHLKDSRDTTEALFMCGLCCQMTNQRDACIKAFTDARDMLGRLIKVTEDTAVVEEMQTLFNDVDEKVKQVSTEEFWAGGDAGDAQNEEIDKELVELEKNEKKRLIVDDNDVEDENDAEKKVKLDEKKE